MPVYPVRVPRSAYRGSNPSRLRKAQRHNEIAKECEDHLNQKIRECPDEIQQYMYAVMAHDLNLSVDEVRDVMISVDCGHNGITVHKNPK